MLKNLDLTPQINIKYLQILAKDCGGTCLSRDFIDSKTTLKWRCEKGHTWESAYTIVQQGGWCQQCAKEKVRREEMLIRVKDSAAKKGGQCLSEEYVNSISKLKFQCAHGHKWSTTAPVILKQGSWCSVCRRNEEKESIYQQMQKMASQNRGCLLSEKYTKWDTKHKWKCERGHQFSMTPHIVKQGHWCLACYREDVREKEYKKLVELASGKGGECLSKIYKSERSALIWKCSQGHTWKMLPTVVKSGNWCSACKKNHRFALRLQTLKEYAKIKNGKCISEIYKRSDENIEWQCEKGHIWFATPANVTTKGGSWCPVCTKKVVDERQRKYTTKLLQEHAKKKGGRLLSEKYTKLGVSLRWQCSVGHFWSASAKTVLDDSRWCPECRGN